MTDKHTNRSTGIIERLLPLLLATVAMFTPPGGCTEGEVGEGGATCLRPVESNTGIGDRDRAAQKAPEWDDRQTNRHVIRPLCDDLLLPLIVKTPRVKRN